MLERTVNIYLLLSHELPQALQALSCVDCVHFDGAPACWRCGECADRDSSRVGDEAGEASQHEMRRYIQLPLECCMHKSGPAGQSTL